MLYKFILSLTQYQSLYIYVGFIELHFLFVKKRSTRSVFSFMAEQPSQLKFIEWPSFTTTVCYVVSATTNSFVCLIVTTYIHNFFFFLMFVLVGNSSRLPHLVSFL